MQERYFNDQIKGNLEWKNAGVFAERASGLRTKECSEFVKLVRICQRRRIELIVTKSIIRFGRNILDMLRTLQRLNEWSVTVYFELENLWLHDRKAQVALFTFLPQHRPRARVKAEILSWASWMAFSRALPGMRIQYALGIRREMVTSLL